MTKSLALILGLLTSGATLAVTVSEVVYVESPTDTDGDGQPDRIYVSIDRPVVERKLSTLYAISPYAIGGNDVPMHNVDVARLPQDKKLKSLRMRAPKYAQIKAHSLGTGYSTGCPTVGDMAETLAAKSVIDWLNGRARAFNEQGKEVKADWANGNVGMTGVSYNGTLPIMVATTGVEGLKAIIPVAAISSWYDYYRANGLVVNPGGYIGEDADVLGGYIVRRGKCKSELERLAETMGRENGDFTPFWQERDYVPQVKNIKAATFIIHGQADWNVKQKHAIQLWEALAESSAPRRLFLHRSGHRNTTEHNVPAKMDAWFAHFLEGEENGITEGPQVEVELPNGSLMVQEEWPHEDTAVKRLFFGADGALSEGPSTEARQKIVDNGKTVKMESLLEKLTQTREGRLAFLTAPLESETLISGTTRIHLNLSVLNRRAANLSVALVEYDANGKGTIITRGWADPQNHQDITKGEFLVPGQSYQLSFDLEPKQYKVAAGKRLGVVLASTDYDYTLRPDAGTEIEFNLGSQSFAELRLSR